MDIDTTIIYTIGVIVALFPLVFWIRTRRVLWGLVLGLWVFLVIATALHVPDAITIPCAIVGLLGIALWIAFFGKKLAKVGAAITLAPLIILMVWGGMVAAATSSTQPAAADGIDTIAFDPAIDLLPADAKCDTNSFVDHSVRVVAIGDPYKKQSSTAVSIPFAGTDDAAVLSEVTKTELCGNPTELEMVVNDMLLWTSEDIPGADENKSWLNTIKADIDSNPLGINSFVEKTPGDELIVTKTYQKYAAWVNTVLLRSVGEGQQSLTSIRDWEISATADPSKGLPSAQQATVEENKPAWVRSYIDKMGTCLLRFGFNAEDRRFEIFECPMPPTSETPGTPENPETPGIPETPGTPETPGIPETPGTPHTPTPTTPPATPTPTPTPTCPPETPHGVYPVCKEGPQQDPQEQGNNKPGGGGVAPVQTDPAGPPAAGTPSPTYTPAPAVQTPAPTVVPVPQPTSVPVPTVAPSTQPPSDGEIVSPPSGGTCTDVAREIGLC